MFWNVQDNTVKILQMPFMNGVNWTVILIPVICNTKPLQEKVTKGTVNAGDKMPPLAAAMSADDLNDVAKFIEAGLPL